MKSGKKEEESRSSPDTMRQWILEPSTDSGEPGLRCLVFRTNLQSEEDVERASESLSDLSGIRDWSVDLEDRENVLRIECTGLTSGEVIEMLQKEGIHAEDLP